MNEPVLSFEKATVRAGGGIVLHDISLRIGAGEIWAVTGESGSGKTSLLHAAAGRDALVAGSIERRTDPARDFCALVDVRHGFRNLSHTTDFYYQQRYNASDTGDAETVRRWLAANAPDSPGPRWSRARVIDLLRLESLLDETVIQLSNGETRRVLLAAALLCDPQVLLLYDPLTGLDVATRTFFSDLLALLAAEGTTILFTGRDDDLPRAVTHRALLYEGRLRYAGPTAGAPPPVVPRAGACDEKLLDRLLQGIDMRRFDTIVGMRGVTVEYEGKKILDGIDWTVRGGERWALTGPNGAGKSTLLSLVNGDNPQAYANDIVLFDRRRGSGESIWDIKRKTGFMSPEMYQYFASDASCAAVVESGYHDTMGLFRPPDPSRARDIEDWLKLFGIAAEGRQLFSRAAPGVQRLCLLARALVKVPPLLILDEPCQGLDAARTALVRSVIDALCGRTPVSLIYVSHYAAQIPQAVTKTLRLSRGAVVA